MKTATTAVMGFSAFMGLGAAEAAGVKTTCARGGDARIIEVIAPGEIGQSCDVRYTRDGGANISVPYHANSSDTFCAEKSRELVQRLASAGFVCTAAPPALRAQASPAAVAPATASAPDSASPSARPATDYIVETRRAAPAEDASRTSADDQRAQIPAAVEQPPIPVERAQAEIDRSTDETQLTAQATEPSAMAPMPASMAASIVDNGETADREQTSALEDEMSKILAQPSLEPASREPAQLVAQQTPVSRTAPQPSSVGRLVGAAPETPAAAMQGATPVTQASQTLPETEAQPQQPTQPPSAPATSAVAPQPEKKPTANAKLRTPKDVVRATLMAQAAAWNEGDLEGFMDAYWKSDRLKFVSGVSTTKGWDATLKRYRDRYAGGGLGRLAFERIEVELVTEDVAVATGRFNLDRQGDTSSGLFSLVMRRDNGAWRIVHDHTSADPETDG